MEIKRVLNEWVYAAVLGLLIVVSAASSREGLPPTAEEKRAQGDTLLRQMSEKLRSAQSLSFSTSESIDRLRRNNERVRLNVDRQIVIRRPDRMGFKTTGDRDLECFQYDITLPITDLISTDPHDILRSDKPTDGRERRERIDGLDCAVLAYNHPGVRCYEGIERENS